MRNLPIWFYILAIFAVIGIFYVGFKSIISSLVVSIILILIIWLLFRFFSNRPKKDDKYQAAVKQSQKMRAKNQPQTKKRKTSLKVIDGKKK
ncbi:hypothetical protein HB943_05670 [Listeria weihenstephanensis]|uniref:Uncharacterized protein n=1 Tax=Listeria weihenstephanensis TaxID=1006155 RepID=A0A1S7FUG6_9LIST|nr:hypothetical protein [Listeria weihenstephanensis]AQY51096.1 hypothetical protein UE46_08590 [Listeria weihenstephanensis]MBC1500086.1 hypothetical protein [Listeria weihenstephanensis]